MNVKMNMAIAKMKNVNSVYVPPTPDDTSLASGCIYTWLMDNSDGRSIRGNEDAYLGQKAENLKRKK